MTWIVVSGLATGASTKKKLRLVQNGTSIEWNNWVQMLLHRPIRQSMLSLGFPGSSSRSHLGGWTHEVSRAVSINTAPTRIANSGVQSHYPKAGAAQHWLTDSVPFLSCRTRHAWDYGGEYETKDTLCLALNDKCGPRIGYLKLFESPPSDQINSHSESKYRGKPLELVEIARGY